MYAVQRYCHAFFALLLQDVRAEQVQVEKHMYGAARCKMSLANRNVISLGYTHS